MIDDNLKKYLFNFDGKQFNFPSFNLIGYKVSELKEFNEANREFLDKYKIPYEIDNCGQSIPVIKKQLNEFEKFKGIIAL